MRKAMMAVAALSAVVAGSLLVRRRRRRTIIPIACRARVSASLANAPIAPMASAWRPRRAVALYCSINPRVAFGEQPRRGRVYDPYRDY